MRNLINIINENSAPFRLELTGNPEIDQRIDDTLKACGDCEDAPFGRQLMTDLLEMIFHAGASGVSSSQIAQSVRSMYQHHEKRDEITSANLAEFVRVLLKEFGWCVEREQNREGKNVYYWRVEKPAGEALDMNDPLTQAAHLQIDITQRAFDMMKTTGRFTAEEISERLGRAMGGLPAMIIAPIVQHVIDQMRSEITSNGDGSYTYTAPVKKTTSDHLANFRSMLNTPPEADGPVFQPKHDIP